MYDDLIEIRPAPPNRAKDCIGGLEQHLSEGAVMLAFAMHLLRANEKLQSVMVCPDGEHGKRFKFKQWLENHGYIMKSQKGSTDYGGTYTSKAGVSVIVNPTSGHGDVSATVDRISYVAECKGGIVNTKHPGQKSRLRKGLCEAIGLLLSTPIDQNCMQYAVVPRTPVTEDLADRLMPRVKLAGIKIALVNGQGNVYELG